MARKTVLQSISFQPDVWNYLQRHPNISHLVNQAVKEYKERRDTPELKIKMLRTKKKELAKQMNKIDEEIKDLK